MDDKRERIKVPGPIDFKGLAKDMYFYDFGCKYYEVTTDAAPARVFAKEGECCNRD